METVNPAEIPCMLSNSISDLGRRPAGKEMAAKSKKSRPSAFRDFPMGCGRNAPAITREGFPVKLSSSELHTVPVKGDADAGGDEGFNAEKLEDNLALTMLEDGKNLDESWDVMPSQSEDVQPASKIKIEKKKDREGVQVSSNSEAKQSTAKVNIDIKIDGEEGVVPEKSEAKQLTPKAKIDRKVNDEEGVVPSKAKAKESTPKGKIDRKVDDEEGAVLSKSEAKQSVPKTMTPKAKIDRKVNDEEGVVPSKAKAKESIPKAKIDRKVDDAEGAVLSKSEAKQSVPMTKIHRKVDGDEGVMTAKKPEAKQSTPKVKVDRRVDDEEGGLSSNSEVKQSATKAKIDRRGDSEKGVMPSKPEAKQPTPKTMRTDKGNGEEDGMSAKSEAKQAALKIKIDKKGDGKGEASVTPSNREAKQAVQKKKSVKEGEGEGGLKPSESKPVKKKITKENDAEERVVPSKAKYKQAAAKVQSSKKDTARKMPVLDSDEPVPMDSETTPVKMENHLEDLEEGEADLTPVGATEPGGKKRKKAPTNKAPTNKAPTNKNKHSGKKAKVFRSSDVDNDGLAVSDRKEMKTALMIYDAMRRKFMVEDEAYKQAGGGSGGGVRRPDLKSGTLMLEKGLWPNRDKRIVGSVPGIQSGDHFFFRMEMCTVGLHGQVQAGIDYIGANNGEWNDPVAISIIASGGYEDDEDDGGETLVYTGQGGNTDKKQHNDQKLERGNLALERSKHHGVEVRVIRGIKDNASPSGKIYVYDGLYKVEDSWLDKGKSGFGVFKYRLNRLPGQPELVSDILKSAVKWKRNPSLRQGLLNRDISSKKENLPVYLVNNVDDDKGPEDFEYISKVRYSDSVPKLEPSQACDCKSSCGFSDKCSCFELNGGEMPYTQNGLLVKWRPLIYECGEHCRCPQTCRNRVSQKGPKFNLEVFRKDNGGWGVRSWDPIPTGSFICEYVGEVMSDEEIDQQYEENQYFLKANCSQENLTNWGDVSDILPEEKQDGSSPPPLELKFTINARNMGNVARFITHSCSPNVLLQSVLYDHQDTRFPHIMLFAIEHIPPLTELTVDYGVTDMQTT